MADLSALMTSDNPHYCTPPEVCIRVRRVLIPKGSGRRLLDPGSNAASQVGAHATADGIATDGLTLRWSDYDCWFNNPEYGAGVIDKWTRLQAYWGRVVGVPGIGLLPARTDTRWCQEDIFGTADAWLDVKSRFTFWIPIPLDKRDAPPPKKKRDGTERGRYYLRRWFPHATDENLPEPFVRLSPGWAVGPELGENGRPQSAPFPSLIPFWADPNAEESDPLLNLDAMIELVRVAAESVTRQLDDTDDAEEIERHETWLAEAEGLIGSARFRKIGPLEVALFERLGLQGAESFAGKHPISVRNFARQFQDLGTLTIARGAYRGVYQGGRRVG